MLKGDFSSQLIMLDFQLIIFVSLLEVVVRMNLVHYLYLLQIQLLLKILEFISIFESNVHQEEWNYNFSIQP